MASLTERLYARTKQGKKEDEEERKVQVGIVTNRGSHAKANDKPSSSEVKDTGKTNDKPESKTTTAKSSLTERLYARTTEGRAGGTAPSPRIVVSRPDLGMEDEREELRDATFKDYTWNAIKQGYYNSLYGQESYKEMMGSANEKQKYEDILAGEDYQFTPGNKWEEAIAGAANLLGQQARQWTDPRALAAGGAAAAAAAIAGQAGPQIALPEEVVTAPGAFLVGMQAGSAASNFEIEAGLAYNEMIEQGISHETAKNVALGVGGVNAALELVQMDELVKSFKVLNKSGATKSIASRIGQELLDRGIDVGKETLQEVAQEGATIAGTQIGSKLDTGEWAYDSDEVLGRLGDTAKSSALSFGVLNVPGGVHNVVQGQRQENQLANIGSDYAAAQQELIDEGKSFNPDTEAYRVAQELQSRVDAGEKLTKADLGRAVVANERAIKLENANNPELFNAPEAQDARTKAQAQALSEVYSNADTVPTSKQTARRTAVKPNYGERGTAAFTQIVESGAEDAEQVRAKFQSAYEAGLTELPREMAKLDGSVQEIAYNAGRQDAILSMKKAKATPVTIYNNKSGFIPNDLSKKILSDSRASLYDKIAKDMGAKIVVKEQVFGGRANGSYLNGIITIAADATNPDMVVTKHEVTHRMQDLAPTEYAAFRNYAVQVMSDARAAGTTLVEAYQNRAAESGVALTTEQAMDEIAADFTELILTDEKALSDFVNESHKSASSRAMVQKFFDAVREFIQKVKRAFGGDKSKMDEAAQLEFGTTIEKLEQAERLWKEAYKASEKAVNESARADGRARDDVAQIKSGLGDGAVVQTNQNGDLLLGKSKDGSKLIYSLKTYQDGGKEKLRQALQRNGHTKAEIEETLALVDDAADYLKILAAGYAKSHNYTALHDHLIADITTNLKTGKQVMSALVNNGDYPVNIDLALICKKRVAYMNLMTRLIEDGIFDQVNYKGEAIADVNDILRANGFETACLGCFVESRRLQFQTWAETIVSEWNDEVSKRKKNAKAFGFASKSYATLTDAEMDALSKELEGAGKKNKQGNLNLGQGSVKVKIGRLLDKVPSLQQTLATADLLTPAGLSALRAYDSNLFSIVKSRYGAASPKIVQDFNPYASEIAMLTFKSVSDITSNAVKGAQEYIKQAKKDAGGVPKKQNGETDAAFRKRKADWNAKVETDAMRNYLYDIGGARCQSFSDFMIENVFDYLQIFADLAANRFPLHGYTKEIICLRLFGMSGAKWNGSLIAHTDRKMGKEYAGLLPASAAKDGSAILVHTEDGDFAIGFDDYARNKATNGASFIQSIGMKDIIALQLDPRYASNVGSITIGVSDKQILAMLDSPLFSMVIPYHSSGMLPGFAQRVGVDMYNDYTDYQNTSVRQLFDVDGNRVDELLNSKGEKIKVDTSYAFNAEVQKTGDAKVAANNYIKWCGERHPVYDGKKLIGYATFNPKFSDSPYGTDFTRHPNYYKLLEDFSSYDCVAGESAVQGAVTMTFPSESNRLSASEMEAYKQRLRDTGIFNEKEIAKYEKIANKTFKELIDDELKGRAEYKVTQDAKWENTVSEIKDKLLTDHRRFSLKDSEGVGGDPATDVVLRDPNQIKNTTNKKPTSDSDIRFSLKFPVEETKDLLALHNMTEKNLRGVLRLGGFPMPSLAVVKAEAGHTKYGPISVVFSKDTIDPKASSANKVYGGDAYTPVDPGVYYPMNRDIERDFDRVVWEASQKFAGGEFKLSSPLGSLGYNGETRDDLDEIADRLARQDAVQAAYLAEQGKTLEPVTREKASDVDPYGNDALQAYISHIGETALVDKFYDHIENGGKVLHPVELSDDEVQVVREVLKEKWRNTTRFGKPFTEEQLEKRAQKVDDWRAAKFAMNAWNFYVGGGYSTQEVDHTATQQAMRDMIVPGGDRQEVESVVRNWAKSRLDGLLGEPGVYNGKSTFLPSGKRRSFQSRHDSYTLENIVKAMKKNQQERGGNTFGISATSLQATATPSYKSIAEIKADSGRLGAVSQEDYEARVQAVEEQIRTIMATIKAGNKSSSDSLWASDAIGDALKEAAGGKKTVDAIVRKFKEEGYAISTQTAKDIQALYKAAAELPTEYFEAKPQRAVGFDETLAVVVPEDLDATLREQLAEAGVNVLAYKTGDEADRLRVINSVDNARFSLKDQSDLLKENAKLKDVNQELKEQFKTTQFAQVDKKSLDKFTRQLLKDYQSGADINDTRNALNELYTYIANGENGESPSWQEAYSRAYETAVEILQQSSDIDDFMYQEYKALRDEMRTRGIYLSKEYEHDLSGYESINEFRKAHMGSIRMTNDGVPVDVVYQDLATRYPEFFNEDEYMNQADQLMHIAEVLDSLKPVEVNRYAYNMRESATWLANDIMERFFELPQAKPTFADKAQQKLTKQIIKDADKLARLRSQKNQRIAEIIAESREKVKDVQERERVKREAAVKQVKKQYSDKIAKNRETRKARELRQKIVNHAEQVRKKLLNGTDKSNVPEALRASVAEVMACINLESNYTYDPTTGSYKKSDDGLPTRRTEEFRKIKEQYEAIAANNDINMVISPDLLGVPLEGIKSTLDQVIGLKDIRLADMSISQLETVYDVIRMVEHSILTAGKALSKMRWETIDHAAEAFMQDTATRKTKRSLTERHNMLDIETPYTFFSHFGEAGHDFYRMLRDAQDHEQVMQDELAEALEKVASLEDRQSAEKDIVEFTTQRGDKLTLSKAHIMNLYLLNKRKQAQGHLLGGGIVQPKVGKVRKGTEAILLTETDLANLFAHIRDEREIADGLQKLTLLLAEWGNDASLTVYGIKKFNDPNYWTIKSSDIGFNQTIEQGSNKPRSIANMGSAKSVIPEARNPLDIDSVFEVFDRHASDMLCYSAWLAPMEDANRLFNYKYRDENWNPTGKTVKGIINRASGEGSTQYWMRLMEDIQNGLSAPADTATEQQVMKTIGNVKKASVSGNIRVVAQQPTAYVRAAAVLDPDIMLASVAKGVGIKPIMDGWNKALNYAPIAARKAAGGYEVSSNPKQLAELLYKPESKVGKAKQASKEAPLWAAGKADQITWGVIWNACEMQVRRDNNGVSPGTDAFNAAVKELFTEVIDQTQVVDGVLQRSQAMRSGSNFVKQMTAFTGEPTQSANMVIRAYDQVRYEKNPAKRGKAIKLLGRVASVYIANAVFNAFAQSLVDGLRDDDEDKEYWDKVWSAFSGINGNEETWKDYARNVVLAGNVANNLNPMSWLPVWKDVLSLIQGYSVERMDAASMGDFFDSMSMTLKTLSGDGKYTTGYAALKSIVSGAKLFGSSASNVLRDVESIVRTFQVETDDYMARYDTMKLMTKPKNNMAAYVELLFEAYQHDPESYKKMYNDLLKSGVEAEAIQSKMESLMKKAQGVDSVKDLEQRFLPPAQQTEYDKMLSKIQRNSMWSKANEAQRDKVEDKVYEMVSNKADDSVLDKIEDGAQYGIDETDYILYQLALSIADQPTESGKYGSYTIPERVDAVTATNLSDEEMAYLWYSGQTGAEEKWSNEVFDALDRGIDIETYLDFKAFESVTGADKDANGKSISGSKKNKIRNYLNEEGVDMDTFNFIMYEVMGYKKD